MNKDEVLDYNLDYVYYTKSDERIKGILAFSSTEKELKRRADEEIWSLLADLKLKGVPNKSVFFEEPRKTDPLT